MKHTPTRVLAVIGAALVLMIGGAVAYAAIPSSTGVFTACVHKSSGAVRIIDASKSCSSTEQRVTWNQAGQPGTNGTPGSDGVSGYEVINAHDTFEVTGPTSVFERSVTCPDGKVPVGWSAHAFWFAPQQLGDPADTSTFISISDPEKVFADFRKIDGSLAQAGDSFTWEIQATCVNALP